MELKLPFGMKDGKLVQVTDVEQGLKCGCVCPACGDSLVARKGETNIPHFAHLNEIKCYGAVETALHLAAKDILDKYKTLRIPPVTATENINDEFDDTLLLHDAQLIKFDKVYLEKRFDNFIPDIICVKDGFQLIIEIAVTHFVDSTKKKKIIESKTSAIEINLSGIRRTVTFEDLLEAIYVTLDNKKWIYNRKREIVVGKIRDIIKKLVVSKKNFKKFVLCPIKSKGENKGQFVTTDKCDDCKYCCSYEDNPLNSDEFIICAGHAREQYDELFKKYNLKHFKD